MPPQVACVESSPVVSVAHFMLREDGSVTCHVPDDWTLSYDDFHDILHVLEDTEQDEWED